ncbi:hypothetical protein PCANC_13621 [Puccinia coronata f. sp. avenae]|uniref:Uncharacterized protein n=1 Tax=Puccinia coronata f. sp. avenae TaxID=200324 RepID=A0A2N5UKA7_9BASI|nr:hypothetical protein PCANC_27812 [Puccinia coronata f. sp. avenae]PLW38202.1 hypothetical protein PCANC_13621 [Puccinia coronata f. sp. avenae]
MKITGFSMITIRLILLQTVIDAVTLGVLANLRGEVSYIPPGNWKVEQPREISEYQPPEIKRFKREAFAPFLEFGNPQTSYHLRRSAAHPRYRELPQRGAAADPAIAAAKKSACILRLVSGSASAAQNCALSLKKLGSDSASAASALHERYRALHAATAQCAGP